MPLPSRSYWLAVAVIAYVGFGSLAGSSAPGRGLFVLALLPLWLAAVHRRTAGDADLRDTVGPAARAALRAVHFGAALWVAARLGEPGRPFADAVANLGTAIAAVAALFALARLPPSGGLLVASESTRALDAAAFAGVGWGIAVTLPAARALSQGGDLLVDPSAIDTTTTAAALGSLLVFIAAAARLRHERRLELGVAERTGGALVLALTAAATALPIAAADVAPPDRVVPAAVLAGAAAITWVVTAREPTRIAAAMRGVLAVCIVGVPVALFVAVAARAYPDRAAALALVASTLGLAAGLLAREVARPLGPMQSRWLDAVERASLGALQPEPDAAIRAALDALSTVTRAAGGHAELFRLHPAEALSVDVAGYLHVEPAEPPPGLVALALGEPERTLRAEVLAALEVRRPDVRPHSRWMSLRGALSATVVVDEDGPLGLLVLPRAGRKRPLTLEEARAIRLLADRLSALLGVSSALARSRARELAAHEAAAAERTRRERVELVAAGAAGRNRLHATRLARDALAAVYGPAARFARDAVSSVARRGSPVALIVPPGVDGASWAAAAHLAGPRADGPLVVVDGTAREAQSPDTWTRAGDAPPALAASGTLVVLDAAALPPEAQGRLAEVTAPSLDPSSDAPALIVTLTAGTSTLRASGRLTQALAARLDGAEVQLPPLADRPEDLRALVVDRLARLGAELRAAPLGVDPAALSALLEAPWPGNDAELTDVLLRAAQVAPGPVVTRADLVTIGFLRGASPSAPPLPAASAGDLEPERRRRSRPARAPRG